jgi:transposase InsO family protein
MSPVEDEITRCRYAALQVNLIWHVDLHQPKDGSDGYYIAFLDDCSRQVMWAELLPRKTAQLTAQALLHAISYTKVLPCAIWSDNGGEFKGEFQAVLDSWGIEHAWAVAYTPEQNGKIERWWPTLERRPPGRLLMDWLEGYNKIEHLSLPRNPR